MKKRAISIFAVICLLATIISIPAMAADKVYTFSGINLAKQGTLDDVENLSLTDDISVTTSGNTNYKTAAITTLDENSKCGLYPINSEFSYDGSYLFLGTASTNDGSIITLNMPEIPKGSKVTLTYAKPVVTNNGSTKRNSGDPYAYLKIADRYVSINGDNFDKWQTTSVITGEYTNNISFYCNKWGAVAISKIEISDASDVQLHSLSINSTQYANIKVNNVKYYADKNGTLNLNSFSSGEVLDVICEKDDYTLSQKEVTFANEDMSINMPLETKLNQNYYESDFGNENGILSLEGSFDINNGAINGDTYFTAFATFAEGGKLNIGDNITLEYKGDTTMYEGDAFKSTENGNEIIDNEKGIFANGKFITLKNNMEFALHFSNDTVSIIENGVETQIPVEGTINEINTITGNDVTIDYIGISNDLPEVTQESKPSIEEVKNVDDISKYYISGVFDNDTTYIANTIEDNQNISYYKITYKKTGESAEIEKDDIPAKKIKKDGTVFCAIYNKDKKLVNVRKERVKAGDKIEISNDNKKVYLFDGENTEQLTGADTTTQGFKVNMQGAYGAGSGTAEIGDEFEISPVYHFENVGDVKDDKVLGKFANGLYNITFKKADTWRADIYVNGYMVGNNVDQADADRKVSEGSIYKAEDVDIENGQISVSMTDGSTTLDYVTIEKQPDFYQRPQRLYIIGDSLACIYYGSFEQEVGGGRAGWGQQIGDYLNIPVTDLANSGQYASGLYKTAFPAVIENGKCGDILLIECAYNDRNYSNRTEMIYCVKDMIKQCNENGITPILVTPNASRHDYKPSVAWSSYLRDIAYDTNTMLIDLSKESYDFLYSLYGDDKDNVVTMNYNLTSVGGDTLHSSYSGAYKWAEIVAQHLSDLGYESIINKNFKYTFVDTLGNEITTQVK